MMRITMPRTLLVAIPLLLVLAACETPPEPAQSANAPVPVKPSLVRKPFRPNPNRVIAATRPEVEPLWHKDYAAWLKQQRGARERRFTMVTGEGPSETDARRNARYEAAASLGLHSTAMRDLKLADTPYVIAYNDGSHKVVALYEYAPLRAPASDVPSQPETLPYRQGLPRLCDDLLDRMDKESAERIQTIGVGGFGYKTTPFPCEFSDFLEAELRRTLQERLVERIKVLDPALMKSENALVTPDAAVAGSYWPAVEKRTVRVQARMTDMTTGNLLGEASATLSLGDMQVRLEPLRAEQAEKNLLLVNQVRDRIKSDTADSKNFNVSVWIPGGRRAWRKGENLVFRFRAERDCYLNLIHFDSEGRAQLLFPNEWQQECFVKGGQVYSIPDETMNFDFKVSEPFGTDIVLAVATARKTDDLYEFRKDRDQSFRSIEGGVRGIAVAPREEVDRLPASEKAEAMLSITTMP